MSIRIALAGNPNSGKTTLFNGLTGSNQFVGNWPGVTVEKKEGKLKGNKDVIIMDLPGIYSLSPYTLEEVIARGYLLDDRPDAILNIVDGTNIERNLYLTTQLLELGIPVVVAVNMMDIVAKRGDTIRIDQLSKTLGCKVVEISALKNTGITQAADCAIKMAREAKGSVAIHRFGSKVEAALSKIDNKLPGNIPAEQRRFYTIKLFERDDKIHKQLGTVPDVEGIIEAVEDAFDEDSESIITNERYDYIDSIMGKSYVKKKKGNVTASDMIDRIVTNRFLALPIFAVVMFMIYYISVTTVGTWVTDWTNDGLFGDGFDVFGYHMQGIPALVEGFLEAVNCAPWLTSLILDGIIAGVGAVLGFVPQMLMLFALLAFLESCGYMARVAFIMDRIFRRFGMSGRSFIPILVGTGCGVPGIMASRTIENQRDRRMTIITTTFIPCGAKLPIIALIAGAMFGEAGWVATSAYFLGIGAIVLSGIILKKTKMFAGDPSPFVMELPAYHLPRLTDLLHSTWERGWSFIKRAGSVILLSSIAIWLLSSFGFVGGRLVMVEDLSQGMLASIGNGIAWIFAPLGWPDWRLAVSTITGLIAKENVVSALGVLMGFADVAEDGTEIWAALQSSITPLAAYSFLTFNLLCAPCFAAIGAIKREMNNGKWTAFAIAYQTGLAYAAAMCVYQLGRLVTGGGFGIATGVSIAIVAIAIYMLVRPMPKSLKSEGKLLKV